jgi:hypothetical protein
MTNERDYSALLMVFIATPQTSRRRRSTERHGSVASLDVLTIWSQFLFSPRTTHQRLNLLL